MKISQFLKQAAPSRYPKGNLDCWLAATQYPIVHAIPFSTSDLSRAKQELTDMNHAAQFKGTYPYSLLKIRKRPDKLFHWPLKAVIPANKENLWVVNSDDAAEMVKNGVGVLVN